MPLNTMPVNKRRPTGMHVCMYVCTYGTRPETRGGGEMYCHVHIAPKKPYIRKFTKVMIDIRYLTYHNMPSLFRHTLLSRLAWHSPKTPVILVSVKNECSPTPSIFTQSFTESFATTTAGMKSQFSAQQFMDEEIEGFRRLQSCIGHQL